MASCLSRRGCSLSGITMASNIPLRKFYPRNLCLISTETIYISQSSPFSRWKTHSQTLSNGYSIRHNKYNLIISVKSGPQTFRFISPCTESVHFIFFIFLRNYLSRGDSLTFKNRCGEQNYLLINKYVSY
jgi:hypothetical protein